MDKPVTRSRPTWQRTSVRERPNQGAIAIVVALSIFALIGMFGLVVDSGRLYVTRAELQTAADACALAAAQELRCQVGAATCPASYLERAEKAGRTIGTTTGALNKSGFQDGVVTIKTEDVRFSETLGPNDNYLALDSASARSRYAMCIARAEGIAPWVLGILGVGESNVRAHAVATLAPSQTFCSNAPIGVCAKGGAPDFGYEVGKWIAAKFNSGAGGETIISEATGGFRWVDFTPSAGGDSEIREQLAGNGKICGLSINDEVGQPGTQWGAKSAYNTRFGIYSKTTGGGGSGKPTVAYDEKTAPPDYTGYAYPNVSPGSPIIVSGPAYADYVRRQAGFTGFLKDEYGDKVVNPSDRVLNSSEHATFGLDRRLITVPFIDCAKTGNTKMLGLACVLMLNPMSIGKGGEGSLYLEYRGVPNTPTSPCRTLGKIGGPGSKGPLVTTLVQ